MAEGDLVVSNGQYEFNGILFNGPAYQRRYMVTECRGLLATPDFKEDDVDIAAGHGSIPGVPYYGDRIIEMDITLLGNVAGDIGELMSKLAVGMQIQRVDHEFVFLKPGKPKQMCYARPRQYIFPTDYETLMAKQASGIVQFKANDPIIYDWAWKTQSGTIAASGSSVGINLASASTLVDGVGCSIKINGPCNDPIITNSTDGNRAIKLNTSIATGHYVTIDTRAKTVTLDTGVVDNTLISSENEWWSVKPGINVLTYSRTGTPTSSLCVITWRDGHASA